MRFAYALAYGVSPVCGLVRSLTHRAAAGGVISSILICHPTVVYTCRASRRYPLLCVQSAKAQDVTIRRKERTLVPDSMQGAYYATLRGGICSSYLAASVIASDMVATSKTGAMGTVGFILCGRLVSVR